ncbi:MAG: hypothetical protein A2359_00870 [Candidatus Moranbacteria bacterium RIFOXYB1_FULL_43_19]|nr:MAG: hypothetical protein A2184_00270 [Candidatus Moranbacteria bacterium RIFOXYA1_FULL_44_7]OGI27342.1 MAG: hypothetical protein A2359_00870 [Candidatus Moranbacteria bacterium RIFOXYB1_FULL_43_19]OGI33846.1 MAG: hypothetical protein A2420_05510 [Candidatus Moranbacteria bacterium RIFOXYC1_FULL_44_13]OGI38793.1 MAG: hypothetical protein A2612_01170 [Candidatus Moranbacteria bacterium RIFOXYD1_FULL_44_12]
MAKVTPIDRPIDKEIKKIKDKQERTRYFIRLLQRERQNHLDIISNYKGFSPDEIEEAKKEISEFDDAIARAEEAIKIGDMMISEKLERKARLSGQKTTEIKIR